MSALYGCHNKPRAPSDYTVQDGWREYEERGAVVRVAVYKRIQFATQHPDCQHGKQVQDDPKCACCMHAVLWDGIPF